MLWMNGEAPGSSFVFLFLQPWQDILGIQTSRRHPYSHCNITVILADNCMSLLKLLEPYTTGIMILVCNELPVSISEPTRQVQKEPCGRIERGDHCQSDALWMPRVMMEECVSACFLSQKHSPCPIDLHSCRSVYRTHFKMAYGYGNLITSLDYFIAGIISDINLIGNFKRYL